MADIVRPVPEPIFTCLALGATKVYVALYTGDNVRIQNRDIVNITNSELPVPRSGRLEVTKVTRYKSMEDLVVGEGAHRLQPYPEIAGAGAPADVVACIRYLHRIKPAEEHRWGLVAIRLAEPKKRGDSSRSSEATESTKRSDESSREKIKSRSRPDKAVSPEA